MTDHQRSVRVGLAAIICALVLRLGLAFRLQLFPPEGTQSNIAALAIYSETGQYVRFSASGAGVSLEYPAESGIPVLPEPVLPCFLDASNLEIRHYASREVDAQALLRRPLQWDLCSEDSAVLILSTHTTESYTKTTEQYAESAGWRTLDERYNMLSIGDRVEELLEAGGIRVIRDRALHDYPSYNGSYVHAREAMEKMLEEHPQILLVLDLHRDAADAPGGGQMRTRVTLGDGISAQLMLVLGTNHDRWQENLSLGLKLMAQLELQAPGITRPLLLRQSRFNQDLSPGALLVEVGAAGNTHPEALRAAEELARAILALAKGTTAPPDGG